MSLDAIPHLPQADIELVLMLCFGFVFALELLLERNEVVRVVGRVVRGAARVRGGGGEWRCGGGGGGGVRSEGEDAWVGVGVVHFFGWGLGVWMDKSGSWGLIDGTLVSVGVVEMVLFKGSFFWD